MRITFLHYLYQNPVLYYIHHVENGDFFSNSLDIDGLVHAGIGCFQVRYKGPLNDGFLSYAVSLKNAIAGRIPFLINDHVDAAKDIDADGVHIGQGDMPPADARAILGDGKIIGLTAYTQTQLRAVDPGVVDYVGTGPVYETMTKKGKPVLTPIGLAALMPFAPVPVVGIGGITPNNAPDVIHAGANGIAVMTGISEANNPVQAARNYKQAIA